MIRHKLSFVRLLALVMSAPDLYADPTPLRDDLQVRRVLELERNSFRISKDPRDDKLYVLIGNGKIVRVDLPNPEQRVGETIAQGRPNAAGELMWTLIRPDVDLPADVPIDAIREADASGTIRATNPTDEASYALSTLNGDIARLPRIVVASPEQYGIEFPRSLFIGADGTFYVTLDVEAANAPRLVPVASSADHGFTNVQGFDIAHDGAFYIGAITREGGRVNNIARGELDASGGRTWRTIARTEPIQPGTKNHPHPGITLSPDDRWVYLNSGSRTDHGEVAPGTDVPEGTREVPLSSSILRVPANPEAEIVIPASEAALRASGYKFADGFRNAFDMAFNARGELFAADNGPDSDLPDALMWVREGHHFGFPWRMGGIDNPQRFPDYDPAVDNYILFTRSGARNDGLFHNDPTYPPPPMAFSDPVINIGPDADRLRDPESGEAFDASDAGMTVKTFTPHSSPLGVTFDVDNAFGGPYTGDGFVLRTGGDCCNLINSFNDPDEDLLHLELERVGDNYQARVTRIVEGFRGPMDAEIVDNKMYVIERSGPRSLWEITFPVARLTAVDEVEEGAALPEDDSLEQNYPNPFNPETTIVYRLKTGGAVRLTVFDLLGQKVATLVSGHAEAGSYSARWDGRDESGSAVASGVYLYRLVTPEFQEARRLALLR